MYFVWLASTARKKKKQTEKSLAFWYWVVLSFATTSFTI